MSEFDAWYSGVAKKLGLNPNPYDPKHHYNYKAAYDAGIRQPDATGHWPSTYKDSGHPNLIVDGVNTKTGRKVGSPTAQELYQALAVAETGGQVNPFIRTKIRPAKGSTAFGPVQITGTLLKQYIKQKSLSPQSTQFAKSMVPMYDNFATYGNEPKKPGYLRQYDYGGTGGFNVTKDARQYRTMAEEMIKDHLDKSGGNLDKAITAWRGKNSPEYTQRVKAALDGMTKKPVKSEWEWTGRQWRPTEKRLAPVKEKLTALGEAA